MEKLTANRLREEMQYDPGTGQFSRLIKRGGQPIGAPIGWLGKNGYYQANVLGGRYYLHRLAWLYVHGRWPVHLIDHINRDPTDNRIANLREADEAMNARNCGTRADNTSGVPGVYWHKPSQKWMACLFKNRKQLHLGVFASKAEAIAARVAAVRSQGHDGGRSRLSRAAEIPVSARKI